MNIGGMLLIGYLIYRYSNRDKTSAGTGTAAAGQYSYRAIFLSVLVVTALFTSAFFLLEAGEPYLARIASARVRSLGTFALCFIFPILVLRCGPPWLAWRVLRHLGNPLPARFVFWFTPGARSQALAGFARLVAASLGRDPFPTLPPPSSLKKKLRVFFMLDEQGAPGDFDAWAVAALALQAELSGNHQMARRCIGSFALAARRSQVPRLVRIFAFEQFALHAARRGDWESVARHAAFGAGRAMPLLKLLARGHLSGNVNRAQLIVYWIMAPCRIATLPHLRPLLTRREAHAPAAAESPATTFQVAHLRLLGDAAEGRPIELSRVIALAAAWQSLLTAESYATFLARGMVVGARDTHGVVDAIPEQLLDELEELAADGIGGLPDELLENWEEWRETLAGALVMRLRNRLFSMVEDSAGQFFNDEEEQAPPLLQCWEQWLAMHDATERLGTLMGAEDVATAWYGGLHTNAWNGACRVFNTYGKESAWISYLMFRWVVTVAEKAGDEEAAKVNRNNAEVCGIPEFTTLEALLRLPKRVCGRLMNAATRLFSPA